MSARRAASIARAEARAAVRRKVREAPMTASLVAQGGVRCGRNGLTNRVRSEPGRGEIGGSGTVILPGTVAREQPAQHAAGGRCSSKTTCSIKWNMPKYGTVLGWFHGVRAEIGRASCRERV